MALKRATFISYGNDEWCMDTRKFIENAGVDLEVRDLLKKPFTEEEVDRLLGNWDVNHFLNPVSESFQKLGFDQQLPPRAELIKAIAADPTLLRRPIIRNARLFTIGCDKKRIAEMLQISMNGKSGDEETNGNGNNHQQQQKQSSPAAS